MLQATRPTGTNNVVSKIGHLGMATDWHDRANRLRLSLRVAHLPDKRG